jgi:hypothetical protein
VNEGDRRPFVANPLHDGLDTSTIVFYARSAMPSALRLSRRPTKLSGYHADAASVSTSRALPRTGP